jgi:uncharacterized membrane protein
LILQPGGDDNLTVVRLTKAVLAIGAIGALLTFAIPVIGSRCSELTGTDADTLTVPVGGIARGNGKSFCYKDRAGQRIRFVLARGSDGHLRSVFDACRQCYSYRKGFALTKGAVICRLCGNRYQIDHMMAGKASCVPIPLAHSETRNTVQIKLADLAKGRWLF